MIIGKIHPGSGCGDQLFSYIITRTIALDKGYDFGFVCKEFFKGKDFMNLDWGKETNGYKWHIEMPSGKLIIDHIPFSLKKSVIWETNKPYYDPEVNFIEDGTIIDGTGAQDERYWGHRLNEIREWLKIEPLDMPDDLCVINFRGGEYATISDLFLPYEYWATAMSWKEHKYNMKMNYEVHTDDIELAKRWFPEYKIIKDIALNWRSIRYAKHLILSNSAFGILPALLNENVKEVIAPRYWARRNTKTWALPQNYYSKFQYI